MPVLGHAFVGLATAVAIRPNRSTRIPSLYLPTVVALAYLPDIVGRVLFVAGLETARPISHSMVLAPFAAVVVALILAPLRWLSPVKTIALALFSITAHQALDLLTATDRMPLWPLARAPVGQDLESLTRGQNLVWEVLLYGTIVALFMAWRRIGNRKRHPPEAPAEARLPHDPLTSPLGWAAAAAILLVAVGVHVSCELRQQQMVEARRLLHQLRFHEALAVLERAARWPHVTKPGRIEYLQAEAFKGLGDWSRAEQYYQQSYRLDPWYFWCVEDLALLYASSSEPLGERRRKVEPLIARLEREFSTYREAPAAVVQLRTKLGLPQATSPS